ncbi:MAG: hypothetical protein AB8G77_02300 [Rhodothermales bacterium]
MASPFYDITTYWVLFVCFVALVVFLSLLRTGKASKRKMMIGGVLFSGLIVCVHWIFGGQHLFPPDMTGGAFYLVILAGAAAVVALYYATVREEFFNLSQEHLQLAQGVRVFVGGGFLMEGVLDVIPGWFSILDGYFHIASGFLALVAAIAQLKNSALKHQMLWLANIVGLLDIMVIITSICFLVWPALGPYHNMMYVVFVAGPLLLWIHFVSIAKLLTSEKVTAAAF